MTGRWLRSAELALTQRDDKTPFEEVAEMATFVLVHGAFGSPAEQATAWST